MAAGNVSFFKQSKFEESKVGPEWSYGAPTNGRKSMGLPGVMGGILKGHFSTPKNFSRQSCRWGKLLVEGLFLKYTPEN